MSEDLILVYAAVGLVCGIVGALIAPRKGMSPGVGFAVGFLLSLIGLAWIAIQSDKAPSRGVEMDSPSRWLDQ